MKRITAALLLVFLSVTFISGCNNNTTVNGIEYTGYGLVNKAEKKNPNICYKLCVGNIIWAVLLSSTIVAPIYFAGWSLYEPEGLKDPDAPKGSKDACE